MRQRTQHTVGLYLGTIAALGVAGLLWADGSASSAKTSKATLALTPLGPTTPVYSTTDFLPVTSASDLSRKKLEFSASQKTADITVGGGTVTVAWNPPSQFAIKSGSTTTPLQVNALTRGLNPAGITLANKQKYVLAFPRALPAAKGGMVLTYRSGGVQKGSIGGQNILLFNENADGVYSMSDSYRMENGATAVAFFAPLSKYIATKNGIFEITEVAEDGSSLSYTPYVGKTGKFSWNPMLDATAEVHAIYKSKGGDLSLAINSRGQAAETVAIPGDYELQNGLVYSTRINQLAAVIVPKSGGTLTVTEGATTKADWGKPFNFEFTAVKKNGKVTISPTSIHIKGKGGEEYVKFARETFEALPEVFLIVDGKATSIGKMEFG